jgi:hypothetical protein
MSASQVSVPFLGSCLLACLFVLQTKTKTKNKKAISLSTILIKLKQVNERENKKLGKKM